MGKKKLNPSLSLGISPNHQPTHRPAAAPGFFMEVSLASVSQIESAERQAQAYDRQASHFSHLLSQVGWKAPALYQLFVSSTETARSFRQLADGLRSASTQSH